MAKRVSRLNPTTLCVIQDVPALRIISSELWERVKARQMSVSKQTSPDHGAHAMWAGRRPKSLLAGLIRCGTCGGAYSKISATQFGCGTARSKGTCGNRLNIRRDRLEAQVLDGLATQLIAPELYKVFAEEFYAELNRLRSKESARAAELKREMATIDRKVDKLVHAITAGGAARALTSEIQKLECRQLEIEAILAKDVGIVAPLIHPALP